jgi:hypothetical protein
MESTSAVERHRASGFSALTGVISTLVLSTVAFVAFLMVPLLVLGLAAFIYWAWPGNRSRSSAAKPAKPDAADAPDDEVNAELPAYRFGTGN